MKLSLRIKFAVPLLVVALVLGIILGFTVSSNAKKNLIERAETITSEVVRMQVEKNLKEENFFDPIKGFRMQAVPSQFKALQLNKDILEQFLTEVGTEEIVRVKLWDTRSTIIYSDLPQIIGLSFPENAHIAAALAGEVSTEISHLAEGEHIYDADLGEEVLEVYVPIISKQTGEVIGVVETYHSTAKVFRDIERTQLIIWLITFIPLLILVIFILVLLEFSVIKPIRVLGQMTKIIGQGKFKKLLKVKSHDEVGNLARNFNLMIGNLKVVTAELGRAEELDRLKTEYVTILAHRFLTPLSEIKWVTSAALRGLGTDKEKQRESLQKIAISSEKLIKLTSYLLKIAEIEEGLFGYKFQPVSLEPILEKVVQDHLHKAEEKKILIVFEKFKGKFPLVRGDTQRLEVAFGNLIDNAIKYTPTGGKVMIGLSRNDKQIEVRVADTGMGISSKDASYIFTKFFRGKDARKMYTEGSGLGLFIVKNIVERHGGKVVFKTHKGNGTTFIISLPFK